MDAVDFEFPADPTGKVLATLVEKNGQRITLASASDGTLRFLAFLAAFLGPHRSSFYFFEELENGIHPTRLSLLLDLIENQVKNKGIQVVATTHSPQLLGRLSQASLEHASLIYRLEDQPDARIIRVLDIPDARRVIKKYGAADLAAEGWFDRTAFFTQPEEEPVPPRRAARRKPGAREMNVLIIAEHDRNDRFILQPLVTAMFRQLKRPRIRVDTHVIRNGGWDVVKQWETIRAIIERNRPTDLFLLCVDRDGHEPRRGVLDALEEKARGVLNPPRLFLAENAWQEVEVWALAGIDWRLKPKWIWDRIRGERDPKERYFEPIVKARGLTESPGRGRKELGEEAGAITPRSARTAPKIRELEERIRLWIEATAQR